MLILSNKSCKSSTNFWKEFKEWLGGKYKEQKLHNFPRITISKIENSRRKGTSINLKADEHLWYTQTPPILLLDAWSALNRIYSAIPRFLSSATVVESRYVYDIQTTFKLWSET